MVFISKDKDSTWKWHIKVESTDLGGNKTTGYINDISFGKNCEPFKEELTEYGSLEGELMFRQKDGKLRKVLPIAKEYNGKIFINWKIMGVEGAKPIDQGFTNELTAPDGSQVPLNDGETDLFGSKDLEIDPSELPFY